MNVIALMIVATLISGCAQYQTQAPPFQTGALDESLPSKDAYDDLRARKSAENLFKNDGIAGKCDRHRTKNMAAATEPSDHRAWELDLILSLYNAVINSDAPISNDFLAGLGLELKQTQLIPHMTIALTYQPETCRTAEEEASRSDSKIEVTLFNGPSLTASQYQNTKTEISNIHNCFTENEIKNGLKALFSRRLMSIPAPPPFGSNTRLPGPLEIPKYNFYPANPSLNIARFIARVDFTKLGCLVSIGSQVDYKDKS